MCALIMVFDDTQDILDLYEQILSGAGYQTNLQLHSHGEVELNLVKQTRPDLLVVDLLHPQRKAGWTLIQNVHTDPQTASVPIILCTSEVSLVQQLAPQLSEKKVQVVYKPFNVDDFLETVKNSLSAK
jgi:CheY-like chemotaxis protein